MSKVCLSYSYINVLIYSGNYYLYLLDEESEFQLKESNFNKIQSSKIAFNGVEQCLYYCYSELK